MILNISGTGAKGGELPVDIETAKRYFADLPSFLQKIEDVEHVKPLSAPFTYLVTDRPVGAFNYYVTVVTVLVGEWTEDGLTLSSRDFDTEKVKSEHQVIKGFIDGSLKLRELSANRTQVDLKFTLNVLFPLPAALRLVPRPVMQATADGIMSVKMAATVDALYRTVVSDFNLPV